MTWNGFRGAAKRLDDIDLPRLGKLLGVGEDHIHMFLDVETRGSGFDSEGRPRILFERHKFYKYVAAGKRQRAINEGLANKRAGGYGKESAQYGKLARAMKIDARAALLSCSWGLGQVMGFNYRLAGYADVESMVRAFMDDEENQLEGSVNFILSAKLDDELRLCKPGDPESCRAFAGGYNGSGYRRNNYHVKMAEALQKWSRIKDTPWNGAITTDPAPIPTPKPPQPDTSDPAPTPPKTPPSAPVTRNGGFWAALIRIIGQLFKGKSK